jgi:hypothetical protein
MKTWGKVFSDALLPDFLADRLYRKMWTSTLFGAQVYVSGWSFMHLLSGILTAQLLLRCCYDDRLDETQMSEFFLKLLIMHSVWEFLQITILNSPKIDLEWIIDTLMDTLFFMIGVKLSFLWFPQNGQAMESLSMLDLKKN